MDGTTPPIKKKRRNPIEQAAEHRAEMGLPMHEVKERTCLHCGQKFLSEWIGNRICRACVKQIKAQDEQTD